MKQIFSSLMVIFICILAFACGSSPIQYHPNFTSIPDPIKVIKTTIERQSPAYQPVVKVEVTEKYLRVNQLESGYGPYDRSHYEVVRTIYYEDIGGVNVYHDKVWWAAITDKSGEITLYVYPLEEKPTKRFVDAMYAMIDKTR